MRKTVFEKVERGEPYYWERVDRNIGWIKPYEQEILRQSVVGVAGTGGMGGLLTAILVRAGFGEIRICDKENFDLSNLNRQFAARRDTVGKSKALETAKELRRITDDMRIIVYEDGICPETVKDFVQGCDLVLDEIEFFSVGGRTLLNEVCRAEGVPVLNANVVGFGSRLFYFTPASFTMRELLGYENVEAAYAMENAARAGSMKDRLEIIRRVMIGLVPEVPNYKSDDVEILHSRLVQEGKGAIFATNPPLAAGFVADRLVLQLLKKKGEPRDIVYPPEMPGYLYVDVAKIVAKVITGKWW